MHNFYERKEYPTLNRLLQVLKEKMEGGFLCGSFDEDLKRLTIKDMYINRLR